MQAHSKEINMTEPILEFTSHIDGRNADVTIYPDRIEWRKRSLIGRGDTNMIHMRQIQGVTSKGGLLHTTVQIRAGLDTIGLRVGKDQAATVRATLTELIT